MAWHQPDRAAVPGRRGIKLVLVSIVLLLLVVLLIGFGVWGKGLPRNSWVGRLAPGGDEEAARAVEPATGAEETAGEEPTGPFGGVEHSLARVATYRQRAVEAVSRLYGMLEEDAPEHDPLGEVSDALAALDGSLREARAGVEGLEGQIGEPPTPPAETDARSEGTGWRASLERIVLGAFALLGWVLYFRVRRRGKSAETAGPHSLERRVLEIEAELRSMKARQSAASSISSEAPDRRVNALEQQLRRHANTLSNLEQEVEEVLSRVDELKRHGLTRTAGLDIRSHGGPADARSNQFPGSAGRFSGPVREIKSQIPASARDMEFVGTHKLLVAKRRPAGHRFKVFRDSETQDLKVVPWVESARHMDELAWLHGVFEVQWNGNGDVAVLSDPDLEQTSEGFRVRSKGHLSVG